MRYQNKPQDSNSKKDQNEQEKAATSTGGGYSPVGWSDDAIAQGERSVDAPVVREDKEDRYTRRKKQQLARQAELTVTPEDEERWKKNRERTLKNRRDGERTLASVLSSEKVSEAVDAVVDNLVPDFGVYAEAVKEAANKIGEDTKERMEKNEAKKEKEDKERKRAERKAEIENKRREKERLKQEEKERKREKKREKDLERREKKQAKRHAEMNKRDQEIRDCNRKTGGKRVTFGNAAPDKDRIREDLLNRFQKFQALGLVLDVTFDGIRDHLVSDLRDGAFTFNSIQWSKKFEKILYDHYQEVSIHFNKNMQRQLNVKSTQKERDDIRSELSDYYRGLAVKRADLTSMAALDHARTCHKETEIELKAGLIDEKDFADHFDSKLEAKFHDEINIISASETQRAAEAAKYVEASILDAGKTNINKRSRKIKAKNKKHWHVSGCNPDRKSHVEAGESQKDIELGSYFDVGGEKMLFPTDHVCNPTAFNSEMCQCTVIYNLTDDQVKKRQAL